MMDRYRCDVDVDLSMNENRQHYIGGRAAKGLSKITQNTIFICVTEGSAMLRDWRWFKGHFVIYLASAVSIMMATYGSDGTSWLLVAWTVLIGLHFLTIKTLNVDEDWGENRAYQLRKKTYDHKHIDQIVNSAVDGNPDVDPAAPKRD